MDAQAHQPINAQLLSLPQVANRLGLSYATVWRATSRGKLPVPTIEVGGRTYVFAAALDDLARRAANERNPNADIIF